MYHVTYFVVKIINSDWIIQYWNALPSHFTTVRSPSWPGQPAFHGRRMKDVQFNIRINSTPLLSHWLRPYSVCLCYECRSLVKWKQALKLAERDSHIIITGWIFTKYLEQLSVCMAAPNALLAMAYANTMALWPKGADIKTNCDSSQEIAGSEWNYKHFYHRLHLASLTFKSV